MTVFAQVDGRANDPAVVLHASLGCTLEMWDAQADALVAAGWRVLRYDYRGHGRSDVLTGDCTLGDLGGDVAALMAEHGVTRAAHVGLSLGGMVSMWLAEHRRELVSALVLCATSAALGPAQAWRERAAAVRAGGTQVLADALLSRWLTADFATARPERVDWLRAQIVSTSAEGYAGCCAAIATMDLDDALPSITAPSLVLVGRQDPATPVEHAQHIADRVPDATLTVLDPGAHLLNVERPDEVTHAVLHHLTPLRSAAGAGATA